MEYAPGGDCGSLLTSRGAFPPTLARLYIAETVVAVEYLHSHGVVHRDLKPENLLITAKGHIKVTDFGISKLGLMRPTSNVYKTPTKDIIREFRDKEATGTAAYMAPEVLLMKGYGRPVDWWSLGILLYTFLFRYEPFTGASQREIVRRIVYDEIPWTFDDYCPPQKAKELITELLRKNPAHRLGTGGANEIKMHPFLRDLDFGNLLSQKPLFIPNLKSDEDIRYFNTHSMKYEHMDSDEEDTSDDNEWPEVQNFLSPYRKFSKLYITNTERMTNEEPKSPSGCSLENSEKPSDIQKESSLSKSDGESQCFTVKHTAASSPSVSESPVQTGKRSALKLRKQQETETVKEGERRRGSIFRRIISSCRRRLSRAARAIRESCIFSCCLQGSLDLLGTENPYI
ncbi:microtubule-associated serine/threonine-protein kinase 1-like [Anomaloglossus baeobatrachus]|uniref:microtubule-associated serine/threonine-protein kinase 1-like n=1 Tax=Anomaloglossus baeobatrachus TaxID=238106 RepID=UPI003F4FA766